MRFKIKISCIFILFSSVLWAETLTVSTIEGSPVSDIASLILQEIYNRAGLNLNVIPMPALRATVESTGGNIDGETHRVLSYGTKHPDLILVSEPYYNIETVLFTQKDNPALHVDKESLTQYRISILKGVVKALELTKNYREVIEFDTSDQMMQFLSLRRTDFALLSRLNGISVINRLGIRGLVTYSPPLEITILYHYLHKSHSDLVPLLEKTIRELRDSGELEEITARAETRIMGRIMSSH